MNSSLTEPQPGFNASATENALRNYREAIQAVNTSYGTVSSAMSGISEYATRDEVASSLEKMEAHLEFIKEAIATAEFYAGEIANLAVVGSGLDELRHYNSARWDYYRQLELAQKAN